MIMEGDPFVVIEGTDDRCSRGRRHQGYIYIRSEYPHAVEAMNAAISAAKRAGYLGARIGGSGHSFDLEVRVGAAPMSAARKPRCWRASRPPRRSPRQAALPAHRGCSANP
jgi:formate dehydrogenase iron-sulfur subunit